MSRFATLVLAAVIGVVLGVGWAYIAGTVFADGYDVALGVDDGRWTDSPGLGWPSRSARRF